jgi:hypothetical protein
MSTIRNRGILVTGVMTTLRLNIVEEAHQRATELFPKNLVSAVSDSKLNGLKSFAVFPSGAHQDVLGESFENLMDELVRWLDAQAFEDGSNALTWVEVVFGDEGLSVRTNNQGADDERPPNPYVWNEVELE